MTKSFTLIELLIVIVIIGILASLAMPEYKKIVTRAQNVEAMQNLTAITGGLERYLLETGRFPDDQRPDVPIPSADQIGIKVPTETSEGSHFWYAYVVSSAGNPQLVSLSAQNRSYKNDPAAFPSGAVFQYEVKYWYNQPNDPIYGFGPGQAVGSGWYKYLSRCIFISTTEFSHQKGWTD
ncbi:MAG: prepilin-type N-terminal cleavage/methylation domain-containing protein [Candidatus Omnitrophica bacterium]|nr:prepilin-type N-terminal cleavage/methylation domain-containing protein [Candidatus Omnitrophota bacterium]